MTIKPGKGEPLIQPHHLIPKGSKAPCSMALMVFSSTALKHAQEILNAEESGSPAPLLRFYVSKGCEESVCIAQPCFGAPAATAALESLIAWGIDTYIVVGLAGSITPELRIGDILVPIWAVREEGTSYHYFEPDYVPKPDPFLTELLITKLSEVGKEHNVKIRSGGVWTTDAPLRETKDKIRKYSSRGVMAVEMEASALMSVASYRGVKLSIALAISDELFGDSWIPGFHTPQLKIAEKVVVESAARTLFSLIMSNER